MATGGKEKVKYYKRPQIPGTQASVPIIRYLLPLQPPGHLCTSTRYAPDVSHVPDDFTAEFLARRDSYSNVRR